MSDNKGNSRKMPKSVQERVQEYRKNNPELNKLSREKAKLAILKRKVEDPNFLLFNFITMGLVTLGHIANAISTATTYF